MSDLLVGVRELRNHLSEYLRRVKAGEILIITEHGKPIGRIVPTGQSIEERMRSLAEAGFLAWNENKLEPSEPVAVNRGDRMVSDLIAEDRGIDYIS